MYAAIRSATPRASLRSFSTSASRADLAKLTLIGRLGKDPELRTGRNDKEYVSYAVATNSYPGTVDSNGERQSHTTWHRVVSFNEAVNKYLTTFKGGSKVYVEAAYELRDPEPNADPSTPQGQRTIFLRHETMRLISLPPNKE